MIVIDGKLTDVIVKLEHALSSVRSGFNDQATKPLMYSYLKSDKNDPFSDYMVI